MQLPSIPSVVYNCIEPSTGNKIEFRPYTVGHEKALLLAQETNDPATMLSTLQRVIDDCTFNKLDIKSLPIFSIEALFLQIHGKSAGETAEIVVSCQTEGCTGTHTVELDITQIPVVRDPNHTNVIFFSEDSGVTMKYPTAESEGDGEEFMAACIENIFVGETVYLAKNSSPEELRGWLLNLSNEQFTKIIDFFATMPRVEQEVKFKCKVCGKDNDVKLTGLNSFF